MATISNCNGNGSMLKMRREPRESRRQSGTLTIGDLPRNTWRYQSPALTKPKIIGFNESTEPKCKS